MAGGIENLVRSFLGQLLHLNRSNHYTVLVPAEVRYDFDTRDRPNFTFAAVDGPGAYARRHRLRGPARRPPRRPARDRDLPRRRQLAGETEEEHGRHRACDSGVLEFRKGNL